MGPTQRHRLVPIFACCIFFRDNFRDYSLTLGIYAIKITHMLNWVTIDVMTETYLGVIGRKVPLKGKTLPHEFFENTIIVGEHLIIKQGGVPSILVWG